MRFRRIDRDPDAPVAVAAVIIVVCGLFAAFLFAASADITTNSVRDVRAAYGGRGESGTVTVTDLRKASGRGSDRCIAAFRPDAGGPPLEEVRVHMDGPCEIGRTEEGARLVEGERHIFSAGDYDRAFVDGNAGGSITVLILMNLFCLGLGIPFAFFALALTAQLATTLVMRARRRIAGTRR
ncbi:hypothetical protein O4J56_02495 [Nocardiopsis sp. RSe5-2]|uniref:DUF3592 domain-containing protein n=1 Tax=Nocardiopsis endophytica TaxID=3018445 RepID=A0ABT4TXV4_9ACTN|nr:hypothetical protein [Nocardiopsis endophytica]MDA2809497.1 hypothetical protein [Nocardiopsis endophytica]